jgi:hypothetical protein
MAVLFDPDAGTAQVYFGADTHAATARAGLALRGTQPWGLNDFKAPREAPQQDMARGAFAADATLKTNKSQVAVTELK